MLVPFASGEALPLPDVSVGVGKLRVSTDDVRELVAREVSELVTPPASPAPAPGASTGPSAAPSAAPPDAGSGQAPPVLAAWGMLLVALAGCLLVLRSARRGGRGLVGLLVLFAWVAVVVGVGASSFGVASGWAWWLTLAVTGAAATAAGFALGSRPAAPRAA